MIEILHRYTKAVMYRSETAETVAQAVSEATNAKVNLSGADMSGADLSGADMSGADMSGADLSGADLSCADLSCANLRSANLSCAYLIGANLSGADLRSANMRSADLRSADLSGADMSGADMRGIKNIPAISAARLVVAPEGNLIGWKKCVNGVIVKLRIPEDAKRSNGTGRKCRAEFADVIEVIGADLGISQHDGETKYVAGTRVPCDQWCEDRWQECAGGIHFFITREEAENY